MRSSLFSLFYWWVIAAAFIGPGTVTTAARAGAQYGYQLVWAVLFSVAACMILQEAAARVTIVTGQPLAQVMGQQLGRWIMLAVAIAVAIGCLAYEAGNVTGAAAGIALLGDLRQEWIVVATGAAAAAVLWYGSISAIARWLGFLVLVMGCCFVMSAALIIRSPAEWLSGAVLPRVPPDGSWTVVGLIGTTIVPYALFLGSGLARGRQVPEMRRGTVLSVGVGGLITLAILVTGTAVSGEFQFASLAVALETAAGPLFAVCFAFGLFAAGFTSAITAPTALGMVVESIWPAIPQTATKSIRVAVVLFGTLVSLSHFQSVAIIIAAQALNGLLLPLTGVTLALVLHRPALRAAPYATGPLGSLALISSVCVTIVLGITAIVRLCE